AGAAAIAQTERYGWDQVNHALVETYLRVIRQRSQGATPRSSPVP
ncbi:MAG TPA: glycosyltransferase family 1 protein, partial [Sphingobium sp.]|nr:glycosyltransferase family 1 protein [Sphingobium sp.]